MTGSSDAELIAAVLDGDIDAFMQAELERLATGGERARGDDPAGSDTADNGTGNDEVA